MPRPIKYPAIFEELTYKVIGLGYAIHKELGPAHKELVYQHALSKLLEDEKIPFAKEVQLPVLFLGKKVGTYIPDFIVDQKVIIEVKAMQFLPEAAGTQLNYYLKTTGYRVGLILNFGARRLQMKRRIYG